MKEIRDRMSMLLVGQTAEFVHRLAHTVPAGSPPFDDGILVDDFMLGTRPARRDEATGDCAGDDSIDKREDEARRVLCYHVANAAIYVRNHIERSRSFAVSESVTRRFTGGLGEHVTQVRHEIKVTVYRVR